MFEFTNKTKDRPMLEAAINGTLIDVERKIRDNTRLINRLSHDQRGLKELRHVLMSARAHLKKRSEPRGGRRNERSNEL
jgi:hypothetical protein